jgi:hypothetical protein
VDSEASILWGVLFGAIGTGYFIYGKNQRSPVPLVCGVALVLLPYFMPNAWVLVLVGVVIMAVPRFLQL